MFETFQYEDIDKNKIHGKNILIDVRSPKEYINSTIPGAINIPIFNDKERKVIGTTYVQDSVEKAKKIGINAFKLDGGYKKYRKYINKVLPKTIEGVQFIVLYGNTGTGKTHILEALENQGMDILDLERCANHRGSLLGSVGLGEQNSQKQFESLLYESLKNRKSNMIFVEGESKRIGKVIIPYYIYNAINNGISIKIEASMKYRINNIMKDYVHGTDDELISSLDFLRKYMGNKSIDKFIYLISENRYEKVTEDLMTNYYDPLYEHNNRDIKAVFYNKDCEKVARVILCLV